MAPGRREFLQQFGIAAGLSALAPSLQGLVAFAEGAAVQRSAPSGTGYGPLRPAGPELALPEGFEYTAFGVEGSWMSDGRMTPMAHDGMAAFPGPDGDVLLVRNHEVRNPPLPTPLSEPVYDRLALGGTTTLRVRLAADGTPTVISHFRSLGGTIVNCAGGKTPWGSWLTCEESTRGRSHGWEQPHGYVFEVRAVDDGQLQYGRPIRGMGRFVHEACAVDPLTGIVYLTEDQSTAGFYRFIPNKPGDLHAGGRLQMLAIADAPHHVTSHGQRQGLSRRVRWVDIDEPDPPAAEQYALAVFASGFAKGGTLFSRLEGCWYADDSIYFDATDGGNAHCGQIWQYRPRDGADGTLMLVYESPAATVLNRPDNITSSPRSGGLVICEDNAGPFVRGLSREGQIFDFAKNIINNREFAGACFSPDGRVLFFNLQGDTSAGGPGNLGMTFAVRGPWERGPL